MYVKIFSSNVHMNNFDREGAELTTFASCPHEEILLVKQINWMQWIFLVRYRVYR